MSKISEMLFAEDEVLNPDLTAFLGLMTVLIPMLLLTASFIQIVSIGAKVPVLGEVKAAIDEHKKDNVRDKVALHLAMGQDNTVVIQLKRGDKVVSNSRVPASIEKELDVPKLQKELVSIKKANPDVFQARLNPTEKVKYENIVAVMDVMRVAPAETEFPVKDKSSGEVFTTNIMFDDITFGNIMGDEK